MIELVKHPQADPAPEDSHPDLTLYDKSAYEPKRVTLWGKVEFDQPKPDRPHWLLWIFGVVALAIILWLFAVGCCATPAPVREEPEVTLVEFELIIPGQPKTRWRTWERKDEKTDAKAWPHTPKEKTPCE